ncbi:hypothetical protein HJC23_008538 [Cyclotella cryptica]|uniref:ACB domain-containing protein n=1 Tax=Cyclotella cryptica TaxID=29204 RepID=A0ABD3QWC3_9STRA|eukprot:CCRYP_001305-RA/>CCRYP_001305-RA protein AED:0.03 eAED:0.03 QI:75/1/1/1/1/1/2/974/385
MRREADPDFYCPQAALVDDATNRRTEQRLAKYREQLARHNEFLERKEMALRSRQQLRVGGTALLLIAATAGMGIWVWYRGRRRRTSGRGGRDESGDNARFDFDESEYGGTEEELRGEFDKAANVAKAFPDGFLDNRDQLMLYGLYKQALIGDRNIEQPSKMNIVANEKYKAWGKFSGIPKQFAMLKYCQVVHHFANGGKSAYSEGGGDSDMFYEENESELDEDGCPVNDCGDDSVNCLGIRQSTMIGAEPDGGVDHDTTLESRLRHASMQSNALALKQAIDEGADVNGADESGQTALHFAADRGSVNCIRLLIQSGADVNAFDSDGIGVLQTAVMGGNIDAVKLLLENGADPDARDVDGETPRTWVDDDGNEEMFNLFALYIKRS